MRTIGLHAVVPVVISLAYSVATPQDDWQLSLSIELRPGPPVGVALADAADVPPQAVFRQGHPIAACFTITNVGDETQEFPDMRYDRGGGTGNYTIEVIGAEGNRVPDPFGPRHGHSGGLAGFRRLAPEEIASHCIYLNYWVMPLKPGAYRAVGVYDVDSRGARLRSEPVAFEIAAAADQELRDYIDALAAGLGADDQAHLEQAVQYIAYTGHSLAIPRLVDALYDPHLRRTSLDRAFRYLDSDACKAALLDALENRGPTWTGAHLLGAVHDVPKAQLVDPILAGLQHRDPYRRADSAAILKFYAEFGERLVDPLLDACRDPEPRVRRQAALTLASFADPRVEGALLTASRDPDALTRRFAAVGLRYYPSEQAIERLGELLGDEPDIADSAIRTLDAIGTDDALEALRNGLRSDEGETLMRAAAALLGHGDDSVRPVLAETLENADRELAVLAVSLLGEAVGKRGIPGPGKDGSAYCPDPAGWLTWLRSPQ